MDVQMRVLYTSVLSGYTLCTFGETSSFEPSMTQTRISGVYVEGPHDFAVHIPLHQFAGARAEVRAWGLAER